MTKPQTDFLAELVAKIRINAEKITEELHRVTEDNVIDLINAVSHVEVDLDIVLMKIQNGGYS